MKGLLIAYQFAPRRSVGALRPSYWAEELNEMEGLSLDVVTETEGESVGFNRFYVPLKSTSPWSFLIKDEGLRWAKDLTEFFNNFDLSEYDFAIITGGPFFHFHIGKFLKRKGVRVYYDFRDPFSYNPRFNDKGIKKWIKQWYERRCLKYSSAVITVNNECHNYIGPGLKLNRWIIPNGFDERKLPENSETLVKGSLFYGGKFYWTPETFFDVLQSNGNSFVHAGDAPNFSHPFMEKEHYFAKGIITPEQLYNELQKADLGVVFTMDVPFESTTKIYDYLALNKKILIITLGEPFKGVLNREMEGYPGYRWVHNDFDQILKAIQELEELPQFTFDARNFSRKAGLELLIHHIKSDLNDAN